MALIKQGERIAALNKIEGDLIDMVEEAIRRDGMKDNHGRIKDLTAAYLNIKAARGTIGLTR